MNAAVSIVGGAVLGFARDPNLGLVLGSHPAMALITVASIFGGGYWGYRSSKKERAARHHSVTRTGCTPGTTFLSACLDVGHPARARCALAA